MYSIDLDALSHGDESYNDTPLPVRHVARIRSEDMHGPRDFTINMERWMLGDLPRKSEVDMHEEQMSTQQDKSEVVTHLAPLQPTVEDYHSELQQSELPQIPVTSALISGSTIAPVQDGSAMHANDEQLKALKTQLSNLQSRLHATETSAKRLQSQLQSANAEHTLASRQHEADLLKAQVDLAHAQREAASAKRDVEEMCESENAEMHALRCQLRSMQDKVHARDVGADVVHRALVAEKQLAKTQRELEETRAVFAAARLHENTDKAASEEQTIQSKPVDDKHDELKTALDITQTQLASLEARCTQHLSTLEISQQRVQSAEDELAASERQRLALHAKFDALTIENTSLNSELEARRLIEREIDDKIASAMNAREQSWRHKESQWNVYKVQSEAERKLMARALMRQWGREECGIDTLREQKYMYTQTMGITETSVEI